MDARTADAINALITAASNIAGAIAISACRRIITVPKPNDNGMTNAINAPVAEPDPFEPDTM